MASKNNGHPYQRRNRTDGSNTKQGNLSAPGTRLIISNLHYEITENDLVYDRSGRSTGFAYVNYENPDDANLAKDELDGVEAKGEKIMVRVDTTTPRLGGRQDKGGRGGSLMSRISKTNLLNRLSDAGPSGEETRETTGLGPIRSRKSIGEGRGKPIRGGKDKDKSQPKTVDDLDKELEQYVKDGGKEADVDMAA
ncbi:hypothetical protein FRB99_003104 [Tulasnella sp. 403]|nr:hypothetical protein FRB99_003104 [Tulasnella sp. 403]